MIPSDIKFYHSGDGSNCDPLQDLGGPRSSCELVAGIDTLFDDLTGKKSRAGLIDYRCFYIKNTSPDEILRNARFYVDWERKSGSFVDVGVKLVNEIQTVEITGSKPPEEDDFMTLNLSTYGDFTVEYHPNITLWQDRFQTAIRGFDSLQDVQVEATGQIGFPTNVVFTVSFLGQAANRKLALMTEVDNSLDMQTITITEIQEGSPFGIIACTIPSVKVAPVCVDFDYPLRGSPVALGDLRPDDEFPVWVRRTTPQNTRIHILDKIRFNVDGIFP